MIWIYTILGLFLIAAAVKVQQSFQFIWPARGASLAAIREGGPA